MHSRWFHHSENVCFKVRPNAGNDENSIIQFQRNTAQRREMERGRERDAVQVENIVLLFWNFCNKQWSQKRVVEACFTCVT